MTLLWGFLWGVASVATIAGGAILGVWWERKVSARIQMRYGPQQIGPYGSLQMIADVPKLLFKEDIVPDLADKAIFKLAPLFVFGPVATSMVVIPFAAGWAPVDMSVGILFFLAVPSIEVIAILLSAWASHNTLSTIGGLRATAQMISYEIPRSLAVLSVVLLAGSLRPLDVLAAWQWWWAPLTFVGFVIYFIASIAEMNRGPFDIPEADSELVAGYFADYSGMRWASFMMAEYGSMIAASLFGAVVFFGGGWPLTGAAGVVLLVIKTVLIMTAVMWVKWTFPRPRQDQLMSFCWKVLTPLALLQLVVVGAVLPWL
ncbi:MAG: NADH-quinone oxidoreductase subunit NuoH [Actinomycetota bacterium]|nr:NADH-quinone oxidoreductase subunit NuoH [Actinomycetota bacterium]MDP3629902.1 NADH-quinone oxidoreductase subunit NuoH [Actinomycetota bacterium]